MSRSLSINEKIIFCLNGQNIELVIDEVLGVGGSSIGYRVTFYEAGNIIRNGILKEYCPAFLESHDGFKRIGHELIIPDELKAEFDDGLNRFKDSYRVINSYIYENPSAANYHTVPLGCYECNNTFYTLTACDYGKSYDKVKDKDLHSALKRILVVAKAVEMYHNAGFLHLDIKPRNILALDDVYDVVKLFDYDSLTSIDELKNTPGISVPIPGEYYAPELERYSIRDIGVQTDVFEIGATLFMRVFGRAPEKSEMRHNSKINFDSAELMTGISPNAKFELNKLFRKTIQISNSCRYKTVAELREQIEKIIKLISKNRAPSLVNLPKWRPTPYCIGREQDLRSIDKALEKDGFVFIHAVGGTGKSELAKLYADRYAEKYHTVQFYKYNDSLESLIASLVIDGINDADYTDFDKLVKEKNKILHLSDSHTLLVVDNFNVTHDDMLRSFLPSSNDSFKVIFTTRCTPAVDYYSKNVYELNKLSRECCIKLFESHSMLNQGCYNKEILDKILDTIDFNTLVLILIASTVKRGGVSIDYVLDKLENQRLVDVDIPVFHEYDFSAEEMSVYNRIYNHLNTIFSISSLSNEDKEVLKDMTLIPDIGIDISEFADACDSIFIDEERVRNLSNLGWIESEHENKIAMHPVISDVIANDKNIQKKNSYLKIGEYLESLCESETYEHISFLLTKLAYALQLEKRYLNGDVEKLLLMKVKVAQLYFDLYRSKEAYNRLNDALGIANNAKFTSYKAYVYYHLGIVEKSFGTFSKAIEYFESCAEEGCKFKHRNYDIAVAAMIEIADCYAENQNLNLAYNQYKKALNTARMHSVNEMIYDISSGLVEVCCALDWNDKAEKYRKLRDRYGDGNQPDELSMTVDTINRNVASIGFSVELHAYEDFLEKQRDMLGEDSPLYQDIAKSRWVFYALNEEKEQALRFASESLEFISKTYGRKSMEMAYQFYLTSLLFPRLGEFEYAIECARDAIDICHSNGEHDSYILFEAQIALVQSYIIIGKTEKARKILNEISISKFNGNVLLEDCVDSLGLLYCELSEYEKAESLCNKVLSRENINNVVRAQTYILMSIVKEQQGILDSATEHIQNASKIIETLGPGVIKQEFLMQYHRSIARISFRSGDYKNAVAKLSEFISLLSADETNKYAMYSMYLERALYNSCLGDITAAEHDYKKCESILKSYNPSDDIYVFLYNNIVKFKADLQDYTGAQEYIEKIIKIRPSVKNPKTYFDTLVCGNIGWIALMTGDLTRAEFYLEKTTERFKKIGITSAMDYLVAMHNLALFYEKKGMYKDSIKLYKEIFSLYDEEKDVNGEKRLLFSECYIRIMIAAERFNNAYEFAKEENELLTKRFGVGSEQRINLMSAIGLNFKAKGHPYCMKFYRYAEDAIDEGGFEKTVYKAQILNHIGVYITDIKNEHDEALKYLRLSKELYEELGATDDPLYTVVESNVKYVQDLVVTDLIKQLAMTIHEEKI